MARKKSSLGCLFYVALVLLVLVVFLFNRTRVQEVMRSTGFLKLFQDKSGAPAAPAPRQPDGQQPAETPRPPGEPEQTVQAPQPDQPDGRQPPAESPREVVITVSPQPKRESPPVERPQTRTRRSRLYFVSVNDSGEIQLRAVVRPVQYRDAPLTATLEALLSGPTSTEVNQGLMTLVPADTRLLGVAVKDQIAYIDVSEGFRFNALGRQGLEAQLEQIVYCATEFPTVKKVQILIEGKVLDYLGPEGVVIGKPLSRGSFSR